MRRWMAAATALACIFAASSFSNGISAAPALDQDEPGSVGEAAKPEGAGAKKKILPTKATAKTPPGLSSLDGDSDGLADGLEELIGTQGADALVDVIVTFDAPGKGPAWAQNQVGGFTVNSEFDIISGFSATMRGGQAQALSQASGVFRVEPEGVFSASMQTARDSFGADLLPYHLDFDQEAADHAGGLPADFPAVGGGAGVNICIIDTGIHYWHEQFSPSLDGSGSPVFNDLAERIVGFADFTINENGDAIYAPYNEINGPLPYDDNSHGTHVAAIAVGDGRSLIDPDFVFQHRGVAPDAFIYAAKVLNAAGTGTETAVINGINWCRDELAASGLPGVISMSLAEEGSSDGLDAVSQAVNAVVAGDPANGIPPFTVVVGAGNAGAIPYSIGSPAAAEDAITVGAMAEWESDHSYTGYSQGGYVAPFSGRGPTADERVKPDIVGPGHSIVSASVDPSGTICQSDCYETKSGTSMSTPYVSGTVVLMLEANPLLTPSQIKSILANTAQPWSTGALPNNESGWGRIDSLAAVEAAAGMPTPAATAMTYFYEGTGRVNPNGSIDIPITLYDPLRPLAITIIIDGQKVEYPTLAYEEWSPDLDAQLLDEFGNPIEVEIIPGWNIPLPGTMSGCRAEGECGVIGRQETVHIGPDLTNPNDWYPDNWILHVNTFTGFPNNGKAGTFTYQISNGYKTGDGPTPPDETPPAAPTGLVATAGDGSVDLDWADNGEGDLASYSVYRATGSGGPYTEIANGLASSAHSDGGLINGTTYYYVITALDTSSNESGNSSEASATPEGPVADPPTADAGSNISVPDTKKEGEESVTLDGSASIGNIDTYQWTLDFPGGGQQVLLESVPTVEFNFPVGTTSVELVVFDGAIPSSPYNITVEVTAKSGGGGGNGGGGKGGGGGKKNN